MVSLDTINDSFLSWYLTYCSFMAKILNASSYIKIMKEKWIVVSVL
jgi:hypothetical protein